MVIVSSQDKNFGLELKGFFLPSLLVALIAKQRIKHWPSSLLQGITVTAQLQIHYLKLMINIAIVGWRHRIWLNLDFALGLADLFWRLSFSCHSEVSLRPFNWNRPVSFRWFLWSGRAEGLGPLIGLSTDLWLAKTGHVTPIFMITTCIEAWLLCGPQPP